MSLTLVPHAAETADRLHVWVGLADVSPAPALTWKLDGADVTPTTLRPLAPALTGALAAAAATTVYTGFFELRGLPTGQSMRLEVAAGTERVERQVTTLPAQVPDGPQDHLNVLLLSCFHQLEDKTGTAGNVLSQMKVRPHLTLFGGDQVYLDLPTLANFQDKLEWLGNKFQNDYLTNWFGDRRTSRDPREIAPGYPQVLALAPGVFMPDDHEYWNNYPFGATVIQNSWTEEGRDRWKLAADALYRAFQQNAAPGLGPSRVLEIAPLSILMLDTRSQRSMTSRTKDHDLLGLSGRQALEGWVNGLVARAQDAQPWFGMLVTGQSFFSPPAGAVTGAIADYEYPDYQADYAFMLKQVERVTTAGLPVILATGDVHWGRMLRADDLSRPGAAVFEVVSSPTSLVSSVFVDQVKDVWGTIKGLFSSPDPWPRHPDPGKPPERFGSNGQYTPSLLQRIPTGKPTAMRGNQALMLRFARAAGGLDVDVSCYPLSSNAVFDAAEQWSTTLQLRAPRTR